MRFLSFIILSMVLWACGSKDEKLFRLVSTKDSGLDFRNDLFESEQLNIIKLEYFYNGGAVAIGDFNNDGLQDVFFTGNMVPNKLYINKGNLHFDDVSEAAGIGGFYKWKSGAALVDINNDGWLDIYVCATISPDSLLRKNMFFINQGANESGIPKFVDQAKQYGLDDDGFSSNAAFFDYDKDGDLDMYLLTNSRQKGPVIYRPKVDDGTSINTDKLYRNNGNGTFTNVTEEAGINCEGYGLGLAFLDVNQDGWTDVYVSNDYITNDLLYINHEGVFKNEIDKYIKHQSKFSMGNDVADINNDGLLDIITVDMLPDNNLRKKTVITGAGYTSYINDDRFGYTHQYVRNMLHLNTGDGSFDEIGQLSGVYQTEWSWAPLFADFDNDGFKDLIITNGFPKDITDRDFISFREKSGSIASTEYLLTEVPSVKVPNFAFRNTGNLVFEDVTKAWGLDQPSFSNGAAYADLDNDGDLDYVVNNIYDFASLYENRLYTSGNKDSKKNNFLRIKLKGTEKNPSGFGSKVTLHYDGKVQFLEHSVYRGYISTVEDMLHFGLGNNTSVDSVWVRWPDGKMQLLLNVQANQILTVDYKNATAAQESEVQFKTSAKTLASVATARGVAFKHQEEPQIDFNIQRTLPHKFTQSGPAIAVGDINGDGREDFCVGGSSGNSATIFTQDGQGKFKSYSLEAGKEKLQEDMGILLFDADNDNDLDLYVVSGGYEYDKGDPNYRDRFFRNDGKGNFKLDASVVPDSAFSGSCVRAADINNDGYLDLFVGGKVPLARYPFADKSMILINDHGKFRNATPEMANEMETIGMISDAIWSDFNNDGKVDLIVVGEFMSVTFFQNTGGQFKKVEASGIETTKGWYNSITAGDFDNDGDTDYIVGNLGLNNHYNTSSTQPVKLFAKDFDNNGSVDAILSCYTKAEDGTMKPYPVHFWDDMYSQSPKFRKQFSTFKQFAQTTTDNFFSPQDLQDAVVLEANDMHTAYVENLGGGKFALHALPIAVQTSPIFGMVVDDVNHDNNLDVLLVGNDFGNEPTMGQYDAFDGLILMGDGHGNFKPATSATTGFSVRGDGKALARLSSVLGDLYLVSQNQDSLKMFSATQPSGYTLFTPQPLDTYAEFTMANGTKQRREFYYGSGYLSQSSRAVRIPLEVKEIKVYNSKGDSRIVSLPELARK